MDTFWNLCSQCSLHDFICLRKIQDGGVTIATEHSLSLFILIWQWDIEWWESQSSLSMKVKSDHQVPSASSYLDCTWETSVGKLRTIHTCTLSHNDKDLSSFQTDKAESGDLKVWPFGHKEAAVIKSYNETRRLEFPLCTTIIQTVLKGVITCGA